MTCTCDVCKKAVSETEGINNSKLIEKILLDIRKEEIMFTNILEKKFWR